MINNPSEFYNMVLVRHGGEMGIKSKKTRSRMIKILNETIRSKTTPLNVDSVKNKYTRTLLVGKNFNPRLTAKYVANHISGVDSTSPVYFVQTIDQEIIIQAAIQYTSKYLTPNCSFGIKVRRTGNHTFSSMQLARIIGGKVIEQAEMNKISNVRVDLTNPTYMFHLEIKFDHCFIFHEIFSGINGLPKGSQGPVLANIRPWIPDLMAASMMQRRGAMIVPLYYSTKQSDNLAKCFNYFQDIIFEKKNEKGYTLDLEKNFLRKWKNKLSTLQLCQACHYFTEKVSFLVYDSFEELLGIVNGSSNQDMSPKFLKKLEIKSSTPYFRPNFINFDDIIPIPFQFMYRDQEKNKSCCTIQSKRYFCSDNDLSYEIIEEIYNEAEESAKELLSLKTQEIK